VPPLPCRPCARIIEAYEDFAPLNWATSRATLLWPGCCTSRRVTAPIVGPRIQDHLDAAVRALDVHLDEKALARLDGIFPGYRPAPEHYAW